MTVEEVLAEKKVSGNVSTIASFPSVTASTMLKILEIDVVLISTPGLTKQVTRAMCCPTS